MSNTLPEPPYVYDTLEEAETASNQLYLAEHPEGTTELLWGSVVNADGKYQLDIPDGWSPSSS
jgi:hypothetical protein